MESSCLTNKTASVSTEQKSRIYYDELHPFGYHGGTFHEELVREAIKLAIPLTLDLAIPGECLNRCIFCGYYNVNSTGKLNRDEILSIVDQFSALGGRSIKILGEGEPLLRGDIIFLLKNIADKALIPVLFTCGDVIGDDELSLKIHGMKGYELATIIYEIGCTVVLKFEAKNEDAIVQKKGFSEHRNRALEILKRIGFNRHYPSRIGFGTVLLKHNYNLIPEIYKYALECNIYPLICPLMPVGKSKEKKTRDILSPPKSDIYQLKENLIKIRNNFGISSTIDSDFPGGLPCDISRAGFYIDDAGNTFICESDDCVGNIRSTDLFSLWRVINHDKNSKYSSCRIKGLCFPKRVNGIV
jgi:MoaA/NifB/PqqE/SkfB family radical SAM enzyme